MWLLGKIRESVESIPLELSRYIGKSEEALCLSSKASLSHSLHNNILTPDKIPEFCLPPRLCNRNPPLAPERTPLPLPGQTHRSPTASDTTNAKMKAVDPGSPKLVRRAKKKPLPFSAEGYGLAGMYESPNTRRKESLFHSRRPAYLLHRTGPIAASKLANERNLPTTTTTFPGFLPLFPCKSLSETGSTESETPSSSDSSPLSSPYNTNSSLSVLLNRGRLKGATSCPSLINTREERMRWRKGVSTFTSSLDSGPSNSEGSLLTLSPPSLFPLDTLHCQERLQHQHILPLHPGPGKVRLSAERTASSTSTFSSLSTVRVRVVSVEGLRDDGDQRPLSCAVSLCLVPGKLQRQDSATIRNCRSPVFNEDFFFTELSQESLLVLELRLKVMDKPGTGALRRGIVLGVINKPLSQLLPLINE